MKTVLSFLSQLKKNNNREWFELNKSKYLGAKDEVEVLITSIISGIQKFDKRIAKDLTAKNCVFRIYKDVRFSKDKTPYKTNMGASINPGGKKSLVAGYYVHIEPGASFVAGGVYMPEPDQLKAIRQEIDYNAEPLLKLFKNKSFNAYFKGLDEIDKVKFAPKGYDKDHKHLELLKHKHFIVTYPLKDKELIGPKTTETIVNACKAMHPFLEYLRHATEK